MRGFLHYRHVVLPILAAMFLAAQGAAADASGHVDRVVVKKRERQLLLLSGDEVVQRFRVALGRVPRGDKRHEGDGRTPEGSYILDSWLSESRFYRAMHISYPDEQDIAEAAELGLPPGGAIMIHGLPEELEDWGPDHYLFNWTEGCIAVTNEEMDIIWNSVRPGTPIDILP